MDHLGTTIAFYVGAWICLYLICKYLRTEERGLTVRPLYMIYKTTALNKAIEKIPRRGRGCWRTIWSIGAAIGVGQIVLILFQLTRNLAMFLVRKEEASPLVVLVPLPGLTMSWENFPYVAVALCLLVIVHEFAHGMASATDNIPLKSAGVFFAVAIPGAFVEVDDEKLVSASDATRFRVFAAGSSANLACWFLVILLMTNFGVAISPFYDRGPSGVLISDLVPDGAAEKAGMSKWGVIRSLNGSSIRSVEQLEGYLKKVRSNSTLVVGTDIGEFVVVTQPHSVDRSKAALGIFAFDYFSPRLAVLPKELPYHVYSAMNWMYILFINVALVNMLPLYPFDGDRFLDAILKAFSIERSREIRTIVSSLCLTILTLNFALTILTFGFIRI